MSREVRSQRGGVFDIRNVIAGLLGCYGVVLVIVGLVDRSARTLAKAGGNVNLWAGIGMVAAAMGFVVWSLLRPVAVPTDTSGAEQE